MRLAITLIVALTLILGTATTAFAAEHECTAQCYSQHIVEHAQSGHFGGDMNPGMHQGFAGFDEHHHHNNH